METDARNPSTLAIRDLSALAVMIEYAAIEAGLLKNKPLEFILLAALREARRGCPDMLKREGRCETEQPRFQRML